MAKAQETKAQDAGATGNVLDYGDNLDVPGMGLVRNNLQAVEIKARASTSSHQGMF